MYVVVVRDATLFCSTLHTTPNGIALYYCVVLCCVELHQSVLCCCTTGSAGLALSVLCHCTHGTVEALDSGRALDSYNHTLLLLLGDKNEDYPVACVRCVHSSLTVVRDVCSTQPARHGHIIS